MSENDDAPIPFPTVWTPAPPSTIVDYLGDLQGLVGLAFTGVVPVDMGAKRSMALCFGTGRGKLAGFDIGIVLSDGSVIDLGDDVVDAASNDAVMRSIQAVPVESVDTLIDLVEGIEVEVVRISIANGRQIKIGGPANVILTDYQGGAAP